MISRLGLARLYRFRFFAWAWAMVVVILISAAPNGAAPGSRSIGSAFDPTTSEVAVSRQHQRSVATAVANDTRPALPLVGASGLDAAVPFALASFALAASPPLRVAHRRGAGDPRSLTRAHGARAPPAV